MQPSLLRHGHRLYGYALPGRFGPREGLHHLSLENAAHAWGRMALLTRVCDLQRDSGMGPSTLTVHRLMLVGTLLATKLVDDKRYSNQFWARVSAHAEGSCRSSSSSMGGRRSRSFVIEASW